MGITVLNAFGADGARRALPAPQASTATARPPGSSSPEQALPAALLVTDREGKMRIKCLHGHGDREIPDGPKGTVERVLDAAWFGGGLHVAATVSVRPGTPDKLALFGPDGRWRLLDSGVRAARFSADANALLFEVVRPRHIGGGIAAAASTTKLVDLWNGIVTDIGDLTDARWEPGGKSFLATRLDRQLDESPRTSRVRWAVSRVRRDLRSRSTSVLGPGDAQIPSPQAGTIAWRDAAERPALAAYPAGDRCALTVSTTAAKHVFPVEGRLCLGFADDRSIRFTRDGEWLAFASFDGPVPSAGVVPVGDPKVAPPMFLRIVSPSGVAHPMAEGVRAREIEARRTEKVDPGTERAGYLWLDWSPVGTAIVAERPSGVLSIFDLTTGTRTAVGAGRAPTFDERGEHVLVMIATAPGREAMVIHRETSDKREPLGPVRDARWLTSDACRAESRGDDHVR